MSDKPSSLAPLMTVLLEAGIAAFYLSSLVFLAGWSYADRYFAELGLNISAIDGVGETGFYAYALWVFRDWIMVLASVAALVGVSGFLLRGQFSSSLHPWIAPGLLIVAIGSLFGAAYLGAMRATDQVDRLFTDEYRSFVRIIVHPRKETALADYLAKRPGLSKNGCLRKVFMDKRNLYAYAGYEGAQGSRRPMLIIPLSEVSVIETLTNAGLCKL